MNARQARVTCPVCSRRSTRAYLRLHGVCVACRPNIARDLTPLERMAAIQRHMAWLAGLMPSQAIERDRQKTELEIMRFAVRSKWGRTRPDAAPLLARRSPRPDVTVR